MKNSEEERHEIQSENDARSKKAFLTDREGKESKGQSSKVGEKSDQIENVPVVCTVSQEFQSERSRIGRHQLKFIAQIYFTMQGASITLIISQAVNSRKAWKLIKRTSKTSSCSAMGQKHYNATYFLKYDIINPS